MELVRSAPERDGTRLLAPTATATVAVAQVLDALELRLSVCAPALAPALELAVVLTPALTAAAASLGGAPTVLLLVVVGVRAAVVAA